MIEAKNIGIPRIDFLRSNLPAIKSNKSINYLF